MKLIIGLGNPGPQYEKTRHNAGFLAIDYLMKELGFDEFKKLDKYKTLISEGQISGEKVLLIKPQTFMNLSGQTVSNLANFYKTSTEDIIVIYDDVDINYGSVRIKPEGSAGGHNGIKSIIEKLGAKEFIRIRLGIKPLQDFKGDLADYVLGKLTKVESEKLEEITWNLPKIIESLIKEGVEDTMNKFNG